jgi:hypothetical protein
LSYGLNLFHTTFSTKKGTHLSYAKNTSIPVEWHIKKFIHYEYQTTGVIRFASRITYPVNDNASNHKVYFLRKRPSKIQVEVFNASQKHKFYLVRYIEQIFKFKLHTYIEAQVSIGRPAKHAAQQYLYEMLDLNEEEYKIDRAYKSWQRYKKRVKSYKDLYLLNLN